MKMKRIALAKHPAKKFGTENKSVKKIKELSPKFHG